MYPIHKNHHFHLDYNRDMFLYHYLNLKCLFHHFLYFLKTHYSQYLCQNFKIHLLKFFKSNLKRVPKEDPQTRKNQPCVSKKLQ